MKGFRVIGAEGAVSVGKETRKFGVKRVDNGLIGTVQRIATFRLKYADDYEDEF